MYTNDRQFAVGDRAVYPAHGVGEIRSIEHRMIDGKSTAFYVLQILTSGTTLMVPAHGVERSGMRPVMNATQVERVYVTLREPAKVKYTTWNRRFREFNDQLRNGDPLEIAAVARDLSSIRDDKDLSYGEKKMLDKAISMLVSEISESTGEPIEAVEFKITQALRAAKRA